ncbi:unnamed protein product, partial [Choristocarpus tenellus]
MFVKEDASLNLNVATQKLRSWWKEIMKDYRVRQASKILLFLRVPTGFPNIFLCGTILVAVCAQLQVGAHVRNVVLFPSPICDICMPLHSAVLTMSGVLSCGLRCANYRKQHTLIQHQLSHHIP